jgi:ankyrin repeat protein
MKSNLILLLIFLQPLYADSREMLTRAIASGDLNTMESLLSAGANPDLPDPNGQTPLSFAIAVVNQPRAVEMLLAFHADPNGPLNIRQRGNPFPETPLHYAVHSGNVRVASLLIANGAHIDARGPGGRTSLHVAVTENRFDALHLLLEKAADPNIRDDEGASPLDDAVWGGSLDAVAVLLAHGARLNEQDARTGATPINEASYRGFTPTVKFLLQFQPDLGIADKQGYSPLDNALRMGKEDAALLLVEAEPKERMTAPFLEKAMETAVRKNQARVAEALLRHGMPANAALPSGSSLLAAGAFAGAIDVVRLLLANGADPNLDDTTGATPLEDASLNGRETIAALLLDRGALVNHLNTASDTTALYTAASFGKGDVVKLLLDRGADANLCGNNRKTPYQAATENGFGDIARQIQTRGGAVSCKR